MDLSILSGPSLGELSVGVLVMVIGYIWKDAKDKLDAMDKQITEFRLDVANNYAKKTEVTEVKERLEHLQDYLENKLDRIETKLDSRDAHKH